MTSKKRMVPMFLSRKAWIAVISMLGVIVVVLGCGAWTLFSAQKDVTISIDGRETHVQTFEHTVRDLMEEQSIVLGASDQISVSLDHILLDGQYIAIQRAVDFEVSVDGETLRLNVVSGTVGDALALAGITLGENDIVEPGLDEPITANMVIDVDRVTTEEIIKETEIAFPIERKRDSSLSIYDEKVVQEGKVGVQKDTFLVTYRDGEVVNEELLNTETIDPLPQIIATGSYDVASRSGGNTVTVTKSEKKTANLAPNGMSYGKVLDCKATAYTHDGSKTKMGTPCRVGAIAVDPSVIPLGTKLYVEGYGYCVAEDTGGKIKGNRIDVFLETEAECVAWGVKDVKVYVLD